MKINVCFLTDDGYVMPTCVALSSMIANKKGKNFYSVYLLCINVTENNLCKLKELNRPDFEINIIELNDKYSENYYMKNTSATPAAIYKFNIPEILKDIDKIIYLDGDIIVSKDLEELYNYDLNNNYIGAVKDVNGLLKRHYNLFIKNNIFYFNSGVMLMNLKEMRKNNISKSLIDYRNNGYNELMDQDALNYVLKDKTIELPFKYNVQTMFKNINKTPNQIKKYYNLNNDYDSFDKMVEDSVVLHYSPKIKPWKSDNGYKFDLWKHYYNLSPYKDENYNYNQKKSMEKNIFQKIVTIFKNIRRLMFLMNFKKKEK